jgi:large subunit ribosomal protein L11
MKVKLIVEGGAMQPGPAVAQQLGPMGINLGQVITDVNKETSGFKGVKVPVELDVDPKSKEYTIKVFSPPVSELLKKEAGLEKGSGESGKTMVANLAIEQIISVAKTKMPSMLAKDLKAAVKMVVGTCVTAGILVENKTPQEIEKEIEKGSYDKEISGEMIEVSPDKKKKLDLHFKKVKAVQDKKAKEAAAAEAEAEAAKAEAAAAAEAPTDGEAPADSAEAPATGGETPAEEPTEEGK